jgi:hypothetical protein
LYNLLIWGINLSRKGINFRHRAICKKNYFWQFGEYLTIPEDEMELAIWERGIGNLEVWLGNEVTWLWTSVFFIANECKFSYSNSFQCHKKGICGNFHSTIITYYLLNSQHFSFVLNRMYVNYFNKLNAST